MKDSYNFRWSGRFAFITGFMAVILLFILLGAWGTQAKIEGAVIATGLIKVKNNRQVVQHADGGIVGEIYVRNGDYVNEGDTLIQLDGTDTSSELKITEQQLMESIVKIERLKAEKDGKNTFSIGELPYCNPPISNYC